MRPGDPLPDLNLYPIINDSLSEIRYSVNTSFYCTLLDIYPCRRQARGRVFTAVCLSVFPDDISKTDAARITKLDIQMFHDEFWKPIYFGIRFKVQGHNVCVIFRQNAVLTLAAYVSHAGFFPGVGLSTLMSASFF